MRTRARMSQIAAHRMRSSTPIHSPVACQSAEAMNPANILCYEMNGAPLPAANGYPLRLIAPGWFGIANVKWLTHIEVVDRRFPGRFMSREYVTMREVQRDGQTVMAETPWDAC